MVAWCALAVLPTSLPFQVSVEDAAANDDARMNARPNGS